MNSYLVIFLIFVWLAIGEWPVIWLMNREGRVRKLQTYILLILAWPIAIILLVKHYRKVKNKQKPKFKKHYFYF